MLSYEEFKESKITDLVYRFLLWFFIGYFLCELLSNNIGEAYIEKVATYFSSLSSYISNLLTGIALVLGGAAITFKELELFLNKNPKLTRYVSLNFFFKELSSFLTKISSDCILIVYEMMSFFVGIGFFIYFHEESSVIQALISLFGFSFFIAVLGYLSINIRSINEDWFYSKFRVPSLSKRLAFYPSVIFVGLLIIWNVVTT